MEARKTILFYNNSSWIKKDSAEPFDVSMGAKDSAEISDIVGLFILNEINKKFPGVQGGLYRDDGLLILRNLSPRMTDGFRKNLHQLFKELGLKVTTETEQR